SYLERIFTTFDTRINTYLQERSEQIKESFEQQRESLNEILNESFNWLKDNLWKEFKSYIGFYDLLNDTAKIAFIGKTERLTKFFKSLSKNLQNFFRKMDFHIKPFFYYIQIEDLIRSSEMKNDMLFTNTLFLLNPTIEYLKKLYQNLTKNGKLLEIINIIKERITYFEDIREINNHFLVFLKELEKPIPLESMGDGFIAQLTLLFAIANLKKGVILMEEPENNLHPGYMSLVANQIIQTAVQGDFQYFISTHSLEFLQFLLEANSELVKIVRMYRCDDKPMIDYEVLSGSEALEEFKELQMDLRGI
ncbi:MAG: AAA family ATPase, partial [Candidatus Helarchaeota archaeon]